MMPPILLKHSYEKNDMTYYGTGINEEIDKIKLCLNANKEKLETIQVCGVF